jgi:hypothetical protein
MKTMMIAVGALALVSCAPRETGNAEGNGSAAQAQRPSDADSEAYMRKAEADWAEVAARPMPGLLERILADDYVGVNSDNVVRDKGKMIAQAAEPRSGNYVSSTLEYVNYRHFGDTVLAQGQEAVHRKDGGPDLRLIWTDVWMWRDGKWQIVASQDNVLAEKAGDDKG